MDIGDLYYESDESPEVTTHDNQPVTENDESSSNTAPLAAGLGVAAFVIIIIIVVIVVCIRKKRAPKSSKGPDTKTHSEYVHWSKYPPATVRGSFVTPDDPIPKALFETPAASSHDSTHHSRRPTSSHDGIYSELDSNNTEVLY